MRFLPQQVESRREFFRAAARYSLLAVLAAAAGFVGRNRAAGRQRCVGRSICPACVAFADCGLPQALSARQTRRRSKEP